MAPTKRPAASQAGGAAKRPHISVPTKCKGIKKALLDTAGFPKEALDMLAGNLEAIMGACKEERHKFQQSAADMVASVLKEAEAASVAGVAAAQAKVDELTGQKGDRDAAVEAAAAAQAAKREATKEKKEGEAKAIGDLKAAKAALEETKEKQTTGDEELAAAEGKKKELEAFLAGTFEKIKVGPLDDAAAKEACTEVLKIGKAYGFDDSLLQSIPPAIHKTPEARGSFDMLCLTQVEDALKKSIGELDSTLAAGEPAKAERAAALAAAEAAVTAAEQQEEASKAAFAEAKKEEKDADEALKAAKQAVKDFKPELKEACHVLDAALNKQKELQDHALAPFAELLDWSNVPPPEPEPEAPAAAEAAAAEPAATEPAAAGPAA